ncbi:hypothetical protein ECANGB1_1891 [Enterospora canceri]|uniref:Uncharacterized protein n=1 Tax=Enterospora canceri TaxID=1081671 RepID=A0A1Y1S900_9MICR|nr:hypothetical protein ECANGB1_1891 [Enterospora canceri]
MGETVSGGIELWDGLLSMWTPLVECSIFSLEHTDPNEEARKPPVSLDAMDHLMKVKEQYGVDVGMGRVGEKGDKRDKGDKPERENTPRLSQEQKGDRNMTEKGDSKRYTPQNPVTTPTTPTTTTTTTPLINSRSPGVEYFYITSPDQKYGISVHEDGTAILRKPEESTNFKYENMQLHLGSRDHMILEYSEREKRLVIGNKGNKNQNGTILIKLINDGVNEIRVNGSCVTRVDETIQLRPCKLTELSQQWMKTYSLIRMRLLNSGGTRSVAFGELNKPIGIVQVEDGMDLYYDPQSMQLGLFDSQGVVAKSNNFSRDILTGSIDRKGGGHFVMDEIERGRFRIKQDEKCVEWDYDGGKLVLEVCDRKESQVFVKQEAVKEQ